MKKKYLKMEGLVFGRLTVLKDCGPNKEGTRLWLCRCECLNEKIISGNSLRTGNTKSCGCLQKEKVRKFSIRHGQRSGNKRTSEYTIWTEMKYRCINPNHKRFYNYGGRGIRVCVRWLNSFSNFYNDMGNRPSKDYSLDRTNNNGNYEPSNCKWRTKTEQNRNTRRNRWLEYNGERKVLSEWAINLGVTSSYLSNRLYRYSFTDIVNNINKKNRT